jgi:hypothetical protein
MNTVSKLMVRLLPLVLLVVVACQKDPEADPAVVQGNFKKTITLRNTGLYAADVTELADGSLFIIGGTTSTQYQDYQRIMGLKLTAAGDTVWTRRYSYGPADEFVGYGGSFSCVPTADGNVVFSGYTVNPTSAHHYQSVVTKVNTTTGAVLWTATTPADIFFGVSKIVGTSDGGVLLLNKVSEGQDQTFNLHKISAAGTVVSSVTHTGDVASDIRPTADGNFIVVGVNDLYTGNTIYLTKVTPLGAALWQHTSTTTHFSVLNSVTQLPDGGYAVTSGRHNYLSNDIQLLRTDANGQQQSVRSLSNVTGYINRLDTGPNNTLLMAGYKTSTDSLGHAIALRTSSSGTEQLRKLHQTRDSETQAFCKTRSGNVVLCTRVGSALEVQRLNADLTD